MKTTITVEKEVEIVHLKVNALIRKWQGAIVNGAEDTDGTLIPCREGDMWCPKINVDTGMIVNWTKGVEAKIAYEVCDNGNYYLLDEAGEVLVSREGDYVPDILCLDDNFCGDYIYMEVDVDGRIKNWEITLAGFIDDDEY